MNDSGTVPANKCVLSYCSSNYTDAANVQLFKFPPEEDRLKLWLRILQIDENSDVDWKKVSLCERHFASKFRGKKYLKRTAIPTLHIRNMNDIEYGAESNDEESDCQVCHDCTDDVSLRKRCQQLLRKIENQQKKNAALLRNVRLLNMQLAKEKQKRANVVIPSRKSKIPKLIGQVKHISKTSKTLCIMLLKDKHSWLDEEKTLAVKLQNLSPKTYKLMRDDLEMNLPSDSTILRWTPEGSFYQTSS